MLHFGCEAHESTHLPPVLRLRLGFRVVYLTLVRLRLQHACCGISVSHSGKGAYAIRAILVGTDGSIPHDKPSDMWTGIPSATYLGIAKEVGVSLLSLPHHHKLHRIRPRHPLPSPSTR